MSRAFQVVTASKLNLRARAGADAPRLQVMERGDALELLSGRAPGWIQVVAAGVPGWVAERYTVGHPTPWVAVAEQELARGVKELPGAAAEARILEYHAATTLQATSDEVAWCSAYVCWCMEQVGIRSTRSAAARSWVGWGRWVAEPVPGCVAVFRRGGNPKQGHVAFYRGRHGRGIRVLGGNQGNRVCVATEPEAQLIGYRMPS